MFYDGNNPITKIINAERLAWQPGSFDVKPRNVSTLAFRVQGTADMRCAGKHYFIDAGDVLYMPQGLGYQVEYSQTEMFAFHFVTEKNDPEPEVYRLQDRREIHQLLMKAADLWSGKEPGYVNYCTGLLYQVLGELCAQNVQAQMPPHFRKALSYIHQHFRESIIIMEFCRQVRISPTAFRQYFNRYFGVPPTAYIRQLRLEYARGLIAGGHTVEQAAQQCGIQDPKYFARLIRQQYRCSPRQLRIYGK